MKDYSYCEYVIYNFVKSDNECVLVNWYALGYSSLNSANISFRSAIDKFNFDCYVITRRGNLYLIKNGCEVPEVLPQIKRRDKLNKPKIWIDNFYKSHLEIVEIPFVQLGYESSSSCYYAIKRAILNSEYFEEIGINHSNKRVFIFKYPKNEDFYEFIYCKE